MNCLVKTNNSKDLSQLNLCTQIGYVENRYIRIYTYLYSVYMY